MATEPRYDVERMQRDMVARGWQPIDLAKRAGVAPSSVTRFFTREFQTPRMAKRLSKALGRGAAYYLLGVEALA
jgi:plasmid maintenance system antidote protein VapI